MFACVLIAAAISVRQYNHSPRQRMSRSWNVLCRSSLRGAKKSRLVHLIVSLFVLGRENLIAVVMPVVAPRSRLRISCIHAGVTIAVSIVIASLAGTSRYRSEITGIDSARSTRNWNGIGIGSIWVLIHPPSILSSQRPRGACPSGCLIYVSDGVPSSTLQIGVFVPRL